MSARRHALTLALLGSLLVTACSGSQDDAGDPASADDSPERTETEKIIAPLLERDEVDVDDVETPAPPAGVDGAAWEANANVARTMAAAWLDPSTWDEEPGQALIDGAVDDLPDIWATSMRSIPAYQEAPGPYSAAFAAAFAEDAQPTGAKVVHTAWGVQKFYPDGTTVPGPKLSVTVLYETPQGPVAARRYVAYASERVPSDPEAAFWSIGGQFGGADQCARFTDGLLVPTDTDELTALQTIVDDVEADRDPAPTPPRTPEEDRAEACGEA